MGTLNKTLGHDNSLFHALLNANSDWGVIVDSDLRIVDFNTQVMEDLHKGSSILFQLGGDALGCRNAVKSRGGCGTTNACSSCAIRNSVGRAISKSLVYKTTTKMYFLVEDKYVRLELNITAMPFSHESKDYVYIIIENITNPMHKKRLIPICSNCLKVRDEDSWIKVDKFLGNQPGINMTHSICPDCKEALYGEKLRNLHRRAEERAAAAEELASD